MAGGLEAHPVGFIDDRLDFFECERWTCHQGSIGPELAQLVADEILRGINLGPICAMKLQLAHGSARQPRSVHVLAVVKSTLESRQCSIRLCGRTCIQMRT